MFAATALSAQPANQFITASSYSGQFVAREIRGVKLWAPSPQEMRVPIAGSLAFLIREPRSPSSGQSDEVPLAAETIGVSCERIKQLFLLELGLKDEWRGRIDILINPARPEERDPLLTGIYHPDGWNYELELPKTIKSRILVRAVVQALLTELVHRNAGSESAEVPFWLVEGLSAHLQAYNLPTYIIRPNVQSAGYENLRIEGPAALRAGLRQHAPLTFQQLSWPEQLNVVGQGEAVFCDSSQLLVESLLHLNDGHVCLRHMLADMHNHLNWQTAFLLAFRSHFTRLIDVEKWWDLNCVTFTSADLPEPMTEEKCWQKLQAALDVPVEVRFAPSRPGTPARLTLQEVIQQWSAADALPALQRTIRDLEGLQLFNFRCDVNLEAPNPPPAASDQQNPGDAQWRMGRELGPLVGRYLSVLAGYIKDSQTAASVSTKGKLAASHLQAIKGEAVRQLNILDQERAVLRDKCSFAFQAAIMSALAAHGGGSSAAAPAHALHP